MQRGVGGRAKERTARPIVFSQHAHHARRSAADTAPGFGSVEPPSSPFPIRLRRPRPYAQARPIQARPDRARRLASSGHPVRTSVTWALALLVSLLTIVPAATTSAASDSVALPYPGGQAVSIIQGYNGGTHQGRSRYAFDMVLADGGTSGAEVVSPIDGSVTYAQSPKVGNGCMAITLKDASNTVMLCHVIWLRTFSRGESITRGQSLGTVGPAGTVGNNGAPHVHLELHKGTGLSNPVPFSQPDGLLLDGVALAATGKSNEHGRRDPIMSTNRAGGILASTTTRRGETTQTLSATSEPVVLSAASLSALGRTIEPTTAATSASSTSTTASTSARSAVVRGTDSCLNVRSSPKTAGTLVGCLAEGTAVKVVEGPTAGNGFDWFKIEKAGSLKSGGWVVGKYLE